MTETSILPTGAGTGVPAGPPDVADEPTDDRRRLVIIGGAVAAVLVIVVGYMLLSGGGGSSAGTSGAVPRGTPRTVTSPASAPAGNGGSTGGGGQGASSAGNNSAGKAGTALPKTSHRQLAKDPFKPLAVATTGGNKTGSTTTVSGTATTTPGTVPTSPSDGGAPDASVGSPQAIRLVDLLGDSEAVFDVTYAHHQVFRFVVAAPPPSSPNGTVFAQDFALLGIQGRDATVQIGDDTPFDLKKGSSHPV